MNKYLILFQLNSKYEKNPDFHQNKTQKYQSQIQKHLIIEIFVPIDKSYKNSDLKHNPFKISR